MVTVSLPKTMPNGAWAVPMLPPGVRSLSLIADGKAEAQKYKWYRSEEAGCDVGEPAIKQWIREHWNGYLRSRWLEHLHGTTYWYELKGCVFGILTKHNHDEHLLNEIVERLKEGKENLDVIKWAIAEQRPLLQVHAILADVDINSTHLKHEFDEDTVSPALI